MAVTPLYSNSVLTEYVNDVQLTGGRYSGSKLPLAADTELISAGTLLTRNHGDVSIPRANILSQFWTPPTCRAREGKVQSYDGNQLVP